MKRFFSSGKTLFIILVALLLLGTGVAVVQAEKVHLRLGTSKEGTISYASGVGLSAAVNTHVPGASMEAVPTPGSTASVKVLAKKGADFCYSATWTLRDAYNNTGPFAKAPIQRKPLQAWYCVTGDWMVITKADRDDIKCLGDLKGKKFFPMAAGTGIYDVYRYVLTQIGLWDNIKMRQVGLMEAADALEMGVVDAIGAYTTNLGNNGIPWVRNIDTRHEIKIIVPSPAEQEAIAKINGITCTNLSKKWMRPHNQKINSQEIWGWVVHYGFHVAPNVPTEIMYGIYKTWIERAQSDLAPVNATLKFYAEHDPLAQQVKGINEAKDIPVHPGVAKYLKEKGLWQDSWTVGKLEPGVD